MSRTPIRTTSPRAYEALVALDATVSDSLGTTLYELVKLRASQINGCAFCVDLHATSLERSGVPTRTVHGVAAWRESPFFDAEQRVALAFTEALTAGIDEIDDASWDEAGRLLGEQRRSDLVVAVGVINTWNMCGRTTRLQPA